MGNDMFIAFGIIAFFIAFGTVLPYIQQDFGQDTTDNNVAPFVNELTGKVDDTTTVNAFQIFLSVIKMFFWTFGGLPALVDAIIFMPLRIIMFMIIGRNVWIGGGG